MKMKYNRNLFKKASILLIISTLLFSNLFVMVNAEMGKSIQNIKDYEPSSTSSELRLQNGLKTIINESFEDDIFPPNNWELNSTCENTWERITYDYHWGKASAYCYPHQKLFCRR